MMQKFYFREREIEKIKEFLDADNKKAMAIYGRRRIGKTELVLHTIQNIDLKSYYYQVSSPDYKTSLMDFKNTLTIEDSILDSLSTFKDTFIYLSKILDEKTIIIIDEFPFLAKRNEGIGMEFQYIIDHCLGKIKLVLLGSNKSFMKSQIENDNLPLYGRFDEIISLLPFSFKEILTLFNNPEDAMNVYALTGGVAQYVMFFKDYKTVDKAIDELYFNRLGRLFLEGTNILNQEVKDSTNYNLILRAIGSSYKSASDIANKIKMDTRTIYSYLSRLIELGFISEVCNLAKVKEKRYYISDLYLRFSYTFIEPNISMIISLENLSREYILNERYNEYLGFIYEEIIQNSLYEYALNKKIPFMPSYVGKWWGNIKLKDKWCESEIDVVAKNKDNLILGECKYKSKLVGAKELEFLKLKSNFVSSEDENIYYLLASQSGFTDELLNIKDDNLILIDGFEVIDR